MTRWLTILVVLGAIAIATPAVAETETVPAVGQFEAAVAPIALYPDALLAPLLMAATYPDEVGEAGAWLSEAHNQKLRGDALAAALEPRPWDPSVKALVPFPVILDMMAERRDWMKELGRMVVTAPASIAAAVQKLRRQAIVAGKLKSSPRLTVRDTGSVVTIAPADPAVLYIPVYNAALVFGTWAYPEYPPMFIEPPPGFDVSGADIQTGVGFSVGYGVLAPLWGWAHADWSNGTIDVDTAAYNRINRYGPHVAASIWHHEPHATGYFHITQAQITPSIPTDNHDQAAAKVRTTVSTKTQTAVKAKATGKTAARHATRHAKGKDIRKAKTARASEHRAKMRLASDGDRVHHRH
jgi:Protein of unknown function (DUF3300)